MSLDTSSVSKLKPSKKYVLKFIFIYGLLCHPLVFVSVCWAFYAFGWPANWCLQRRRFLREGHLAIATLFSLSLRVIDTWQLTVWGSHNLSVVSLIVDKNYDLCVIIIFLQFKEYLRRGMFMVI